MDHRGGSPDLAPELNKVVEEESLVVNEESKRPVRHVRNDTNTSSKLRTPNKAKSPEQPSPGLPPKATKFYHNTSALSKSKAEHSSSKKFANHVEKSRRSEVKDDEQRVLK